MKQRMACLLIGILMGAVLLGGQSIPQYPYILSGRPAD